MRNSHPGMHLLPNPDGSPGVPLWAEADRKLSITRSSTFFASRFITESNDHDLNGKEGSLECVPPRPGSHGLVRVTRNVHLAFADGTPFFPLGTTLYNWVHREAALQEETLPTLKRNPFNIIRFLVFPKWYM